MNLRVRRAQQDSCFLFHMHILFMSVHFLLIICVMKYRRAYLRPALLLCTHGIRTSCTCAGWEKRGNLLLTNSEINLLHHAELNMCSWNADALLIKSRKLKSAFRMTSRFIMWSWNFSNLWIYIYIPFDPVASCHLGFDCRDFCDI